MRILLSGGGTGGHIYPALAVAHELRERHSAELLYLGDLNGLETKLVPAANVPFVGVAAGRLRRYLSLGTLTDLGRIPLGVAQAMRHVAEFKPDAAFTSGGYVAVPAGFAARWHGVPLMMHQQDVPPNLANRLLTPLATRISVSFPDSMRYFPRNRTALTGNPVREEVLAVAAIGPTRQAAFKAQFGLDPAVPVVLVTGGSQGARHINQVVADALPHVLPVCQVLHVSGEKTHAETRARAEAALTATDATLRARYQLHPYLTDQMPAALAACDVAVCRSGAATLAELATVGKPGLLVPLPPGFTGSPQAINAEMFQRAGAAAVTLDRDLSVESLCAALLPLLQDAPRRDAMGQAARTLARPDAAATLAQAVVALAQQRRQ
ncbi:MAG TPA: undecaprenyldiphospho-muramoylpentapeptide beta-N-acetylglucosaminyltransferase [Ktedonobacterales bacterium]|nr:undecaprenyldiphospho-muramoylpentapeptide beta-N-acetylglucosaminyltransferase [Ktedonobacterales bacterium]